MDISERLKIYINTTGLTYAQFADRAGISRPTLSQILSGRNKSVNDIFLRKLIEAFPLLNPSWLLIGRGEMQFDVNSQISEPLNSNISQETTLQTPVNKDVINQQNLFQHPSINLSEKIGSDYNENDSKPSSPNHINNMLEIEKIEEDKSPSKKVVSILTIYSDGSTEMFYP